MKRPLYTLSSVVVPPRPTDEDYLPLPAAADPDAAIVVRASHVEDGDLVLARFPEPEWPGEPRVAGYFQEPYPAKTGGPCGECMDCRNELYRIDERDVHRYVALDGPGANVPCDIWPRNAPVLIIPGPIPADELTPEQEYPHSIVAFAQAAAVLLGEGWQVHAGYWGVTGRLSDPEGEDIAVVGVEDDGQLYVDVKSTQQALYPVRYNPEIHSDRFLDPRDLDLVAQVIAETVRENR
ncbi:hypothetical protein [Streptomyces sp. G-5]|uniref:hypothetical protein n=1 Tax=Streptomyces sp. G-5 TaxID=2977231 RepID=UPI0021D34BE2|nr:hypothetical protein [Streptomyces sp. G-5]MCU4750274.1 hypothetical protein [Streptomyces sp. G-5]